MLFHFKYIDNHLVFSTDKYMSNKNRDKKTNNDIDTNDEHHMHIDPEKYWKGKSTDEICELINKDGIFFHLKPIQNSFDSRLNQLRKKLHRFLSPKFSKKYDKFDQDIYLKSILVDCRALFLESAWLKESATLQNIYMIRKQPERARAIDKLFDEKVIGELSYRDIIKRVVDKRIVHIDWLDSNQERECLEHTEYILSRKTIKSLFILLLQISIDYSEFVKQYGKSVDDQLDMLLRSLTGGSED